MNEPCTIALKQVGMAYGRKLLFLDVNLQLSSGNAYALVGANGAGKSTFFRLLTGEEELTSGEVMIPKHASVGWLKQDQFRYEETPIRDIVLQGKPALWDALKEREALFSDESWSDEKGFRLAALEETVAHYDGYTAESEAESILEGLGILPQYFDKPLKALSGGYKLRVLLAQTLFQKPSILLLDEPTNHLDILSIRWLEKFLKTEFQGLLVFISHDVDFIDNVSNHILDIDYGEVRAYKGNYPKFLTAKQLVEEQKTLEKKSAENKIAEMQRFVDRFGAKASKAAQARSRMKMIEKIEIPDIKHSSRVAPKFQFTESRPSGKHVLQVKGLAKSFKEKMLFEKIRFQIARGEKVAIMGVNGIGKSTMMKLLAGHLKQDAGEITWGHEARISYFSQDHHELLNRHVSVLQWLTDETRGANDQQIRKMLGRMLFVQDDVDKDILTLSGGEAARLLLAKVMLELPNVILLDEPTNHMDLESIEALGDALSQYKGTLIAVSHNRHFIDKVAKRILYFKPGGVVLDHQGNYQSFDKKID
ncbi:MAG: ABC-F family ATP-binding cassette domain-containing protein [Legionellaceae bacterium]|nr:ABC-F family ATP-binding cassette domain-containing protein [Legionellaceae bacterium]